LIKWVKDNKLVDNYGEITVLCSRKNELYELKKELEKYTIKYALIDETDLFSKSEIIPLKAFITLLSDPQQDDAMLVYLTQLPFSISESIIYEESNKSKRYGTSLFEKLKNSKDPEISKALEIHQRYYSMKEYVSLYKIVKNFMEETDYLPKISSLPDGEERYINVSRFLEELLNMEESGYRLSEIADSLTEEEILTSKSLYENDPESLKLMTIHKSKGLENKVIIYINPYRKNKDSDDSGIMINKTSEKYMPVITKAIEKGEYKTENLEYQRLFYVAITRPKEYLFMVNKEEKIKKKTYQNDLIKEILFKEGEGNWKKDDEKLKNYVNFLSKNDINEVDLSNIELKETETKTEEIELKYIKDYTNLSYKKFHSPTKLYKYDEILKDTEEEVKYIYDDDKKIMSISEYERFNEKDEGILTHRLMEHIKDGLSLKTVIDQYFDTEFKKIEDKEKIRTHLEKWIGSEIFNEMEKSPESHNEFKIDKSIKVSGRTMVLTGVVDKIFKNEDGSWSVIDYKYSTKKDIEKYKFQLEFYAYCLKDLLQIKDINLIFLKEKPENGVWKMNFDDIDFECFLKKLETVIEAEERR
jgi:ATP-dependent exoDNAse (exonuclease V) beta subunit